MYYQTIYEIDNSLPLSHQEVIVNGSNGSRTVQYEEQWVNGVLKSR